MSYMYLGAIFLGIIILAVGGYFLWSYLTFKPTNLFGCAGLKGISTGSQLKAYQAQFDPTIVWAPATLVVGSNSITGTAKGQTVFGPCQITLASV